MSLSHTSPLISYPHTQFLMLKYANYDIVFQEYPDEVTLAINLTLCPNRCPGCHSQFLRNDVGEELTPERLTALIDSYGDTITCIGFQGGDNDPASLLQLAIYVRQHYAGRLRTGWYSGRAHLPAPITPQSIAPALNYLKLGPYIEKFGPLSSPTTNQRFYLIHPDGTLHNLTPRFQKPKR